MNDGRNQVSSANNNSNSAPPPTTSEIQLYYGCLENMGPWGCDFEDGPKLCKGWRQESEEDDFDWTIAQGMTMSSGTGPTNDHTFGSWHGHFAYIEVNPSSNFQVKFQLSDFNKACRKRSARNTCRPRAMCCQRYPLPCFTLMWIRMIGSRATAPKGMQSFKAKGDFR